MNEYIFALHFEAHDSYKLPLEFNSMQHARRAAVEILGFLGLTYGPTTSPDSEPEKEPADAVPDPAPEKPEEPRPEREISFRDLPLTYREKHGHSQRDLAKFLGINQSTVSAWERELWTPSKETDRAIRNRLNGGNTHE